MTLSVGKFKVSCRTAATVLRGCGLLENEHLFANYPADFPSIMRGLGYRDRWLRCHNEGWYDFALADGSIFQFRREDDHLSYSFIQCPYQYMAFEQFAYERLGDVWEEFVSELQDEYEMYRSSEVSEQSVTPIRYD